MTTLTRRAPQRQLTTQQKFNLAPYESVYTLIERLKYYYILEVERRRGSYIADEFTAQKLHYAAQWMLHGSRNNLLLYGSVGNGKTSLLKAMRWVLREYLNTAVLLSSSDVLKLLIEPEFQKRTPLTFEGVISSPLLFLDEVGEEEREVNYFGTVKRPIVDLFRSRYAANLTTIMTSNLDISALTRHYGVPIGDRLTETFSTIGYEPQTSYRQRGEG